jgi:hypothetical protein
MANKPKEDPMTKLANMIDERIKAAFEGRDQSEKEAKDPWARLEGIVDRAVSKRFETFAASLKEEAGKDDVDEGKDDKDGGDKILGGLFG